MARARREAGFTYVGLLIAVAVLGVALAATGQVWRTAAKRDKEQELLFAGREIRNAIASYYAGTPAGLVRYPRTLEDLVADRRMPVVRRHLRRVYPDPMTGREEWGLVPAPDGGVAGVYSLSEDSPMKIAGFASGEAEFVDAGRYADWKFVYVPPAAARKRPAAKP